MQKKLCSVFSLVGMLFLSFSNLAYSDEKKPTKPKPKVKVEKAAATTFHDELKFPSVLASKSKVKVVAEVSAQVLAVDVKLGSKVTKGQTLMSIKQTKPLGQFKPIMIQAPVDGFVESIRTAVGSQVLTGEMLLGIVNPNQLIAPIEVPQHQVGKISMGSPATLHITNGKPIKVNVTGMSPVLDRTLGTSTVELDWPLKGKEEVEFIHKQNLRPGQSGYVVFKLNKRKGFALPESAISYRGKQSVVKTIVDNKVKRVDVKLGAHLPDEKIEVLEGLKENTQVITKHTVFLKDGDEVEIDQEAQ